MIGSFFSKRLVKTISQTYKSCYDYSIEGNNFLPLIFIKSFLFKKKVSSLPFMDINYFDQKLSEADLQELIRISKKDKIDLIELKLSEFQSSFSKNSDLLERMNFIKKTHKHHYVIDIKDPKSLWASFHKHTRNDIRKAEKSHLKIKKIINKKQMKEFYKLYFAEMKRFGTPCHSFLFFKNLKKNFETDFFGLNCYKQKKLTASIIALYSKDFCYLWFNVSDPKFRDSRPNDLLYWVLIQECSKRNMKNLDIGQIDLYPKNNREKGLSKFKQKWLGNPYEKSYFYYSPSQKQEVSSGKKDKLKKYREIWSKLPTPLIKAIGPKICSQLGI